MARFCHVYPGLYVNAAWPTSDKVIPWPYFLALYGRLTAVLALDRMNAFRAGAYAIAVTHMEDRGKAAEIGDEMTREACPER